MRGVKKKTGVFNLEEFKNV